MLTSLFLIKHPKDPYLVPNIDMLLVSYQILNFMEAYSRYNQIKMNPNNTLKTTFMTNEINFYYKVLHFDLKNIIATYQRMMNDAFRDQIGHNLEVYINDMMIKTSDEKNHYNWDEPS